VVVCRRDEVKNSSKSMSVNEYSNRNTPRALNSVSQRQKQTPTTTSQGSADTGPAAAGTIHEEWETASESSDVLRDSDSQQQSSRASGRQRQDSRRGYSNQRHMVQSRRGRGYRDRPPADATLDRDTGSSSNTRGGVETRLNQTNSSAVSAVDSSRGHGTVPSRDPNGPNGNIHPVYRLDHIVFDDPSAIQAAISDVFIRSVCVDYTAFWIKRICNCKCV